MLNRLLGGRYQVLQALGEGGLAKTYIAEDLHRHGHPQCVVKLLKLAHSDYHFLPTARRLFRKEAEILEKLGHHDRIPRSFAYFEENQEFYLVQELIKGHTLSQELPRGQRWSESRVVQMLQDVLQILEFVHSFGVIHRDIKPNNLIRRHQDNRLVLIDFGAVKQVCSPQVTTLELITQKTIPIGTPGYMPIEQLQGQPRFSSDVYALGSICIQAITGLHPLNFPEDEEGEIIWNDLGQVSHELATILTKMVSYHFQDRYQSVQEVMQALKLLPHHCVSEKTDLDTIKLNSLVNSTTRRQDETIYLDTDPWTPWNLTELTDTDLQKTKIASDFLSSKLVNPRQEQVKLVASERTVKTKQDLNSISAPVLLHTHKSKISIGIGVITVFISIFASYGYLNYRQSSIEKKATIAIIQALNASKKYSECLHQGRAFVIKYAKAEVEMILYECQQGQAEVQLTQAIALEQQSNYKQAIALANQVPVATNIYKEAQKLIAQWSEQIFQIALAKYQEGNLTEAIAMLLEDIPTNSNLAIEAKITVNQWQEEWQQNKTYLQIAKEAINNRRWQDAINAAKKVSHTDYWQKQIEPITLKAEAEIAIIQAGSQKKDVPSSGPTPKPRATVTNPKSLTRSQPRPKYRAIPHYQPLPRLDINIPASRSRNLSNSTEWICLNNPNPKCRK